MLTRPPACSTRWMAPAQQSVSSSGWGATTSSTVAASRGGSALAGAVVAAWGLTPLHSSASARLILKQGMAERFLALVSHAVGGFR